MTHDEPKGMTVQEFFDQLIAEHEDREGNVTPTHEHPSTGTPQHSISETPVNGSKTRRF